MLASISEGTLKQYEKPIKLWWHYTKHNNILPHQCSTSAALDFFTEIFYFDVSFSTLNIYRSAISLLTGNELGKDNAVIRYFKGVSSIKPPKSKYKETWDPQVVLTYLESLGKNETLSLEEFTKKASNAISANNCTTSSDDSIHQIRTYKY